MKQTPKANKANQRTAMIALAITPKQRNAIDRFAKREGVSRSQAVRLLVECGLEADKVN